MASTFEIRLLREEDIPELAQVIAAAFCRRNVPTVPLHIDETAHAAWVRDIAASCLPDGFSQVAFDTQTGKIIGGELRVTLANKNWHEDMMPEQKVLFEFLGRFKRPKCESECDPNKVLSIMMAGTLTPAEGGQKGAYKVLAQKALQLARQRGMKYIVGELSWGGVQHVLINRLGYKVQEELVYAEADIPEYKGLPGKEVLAVFDLNKNTVEY